MTEENFDLLMAKASTDGTLKEDELSQNQEKSNESDDDSDYGGSDYEAEQPTTFRMLFEKMQVRDIEFIESCQLAGVIAKSSTCSSCSKSMCLVEVEDSLDGVEWLCPSCFVQKAVRQGSWFEDIRQARLKDIILILYCWSRNYPEYLCQHEIDLGEIRVVPKLYNKCYELSSEYFNNEISSIGSKGEVVEIEEFATPTGLHVIGGVERRNMKHVFFRVLPENWTRDDLVTAIADNIAFGTVLHFQNSTLLQILGDTGLKYLEQVWGLGVETSRDPDNPMVTSLWTLFEKLFRDKDFTESSIVEFLFRRRMEASKDPFLFLLSIIAKLHPST